MTRYKLLKSSISLEDFEGLLAFLVAEFEFDKNQAKPWLQQKKILIISLLFKVRLFYKQKPLSKLGVRSCICSPF